VTSSLVLSPHPDDAGFCLAGALLAHVLPEPSLLLTIFGQTNWLGPEHRFIADTAHASAVRRAEDAAFAAEIQHELLSWDYPEASLRHGSSEDAIFDPDERRPIAVPDGLHARLHTLITDRSITWLLAPLGYGGHRDHLLVRALARTLASERSLGLAFYEDLPYAAQGDGSPALAARVCPDHHEHRIPITSWLEAKLRALRCYATQADATTLAAIAAHARSLGDAERIWVPTDWPAQQP
jgi:LmbE family N-acetylglucosaminyl deacetylase